MKLYILTVETEATRRYNVQRTRKKKHIRELLLLFHRAVLIQRKTYSQGKQNNSQLYDPVCILATFGVLSIFF